jgi:glucose/arabinose dehydrogenase
MKMTRYFFFGLAMMALPMACDDGGGIEPVDASTDPGEGETPPPAQPCEPDNGGLTLAKGFCARVFATDLGTARHLAVDPEGDVYVAVAPAKDGSSQGGVVALRDQDGDGRAEQQETFGAPGGNGIAVHDGFLYLARNDSIVRFALGKNELAPAEQPQVIVKGLPVTGDHPAKSIAIDGKDLFVNVGSASNSCQEANRQLESPGIDPCPELEERAGVWKFDAETTDQTQEVGKQVARGARNSTALALNADGLLFAVENGRDQLFENWPELYTAEDDLRLPTEEFVRIKQGGDYGWPYCYHDAERGFVLAPEYGGDGMKVGRCTGIERPLVSFPAHWAPLGLTFYDGKQFPKRYRGGAFIAFHGSRFEPNAQGELPGYNVLFQPFAGDQPSGDYEVFAKGFAGDGRPLPEQAAHRPVGVAQGPDGSLYISDDHGGTVWRVSYGK